MTLGHFFIILMGRSSRPLKIDKSRKVFWKKSIPNVCSKYVYIGNNDNILCHTHPFVSDKKYPYIANIYLIKIINRFLLSFQIFLYIVDMIRNKILLPNLPGLPRVSFSHTCYKSLPHNNETLIFGGFSLIFIPHSNYEREIYSCIVHFSCFRLRDFRTFTRPTHWRLTFNNKR